MSQESISRPAVAVALAIAAQFAVATASAQQNQIEGLTYDRIAWSPDGSMLAFGATWGGDEEIYTVRTDGSDLVKLTDNDRTDTSVSFSADGRSVLYVSAIRRNDQKSDFDVYTVDVEAGEPRHLYGQEGREEQWPLMMNDGRLSVSVSIGPRVINLIAVDLESGDTQTLVDSGSRDGWGSFSADGRTVVYSSNRLSGGWKFDIFLANADGSKDHHLDLYPQNLHGFGSVYPYFFPDNDKFVYRSDKDGYEPGDNYHYVYDLRRDRDERLPRPDAATIGMPTVSPDGTTIAFAADYNNDGSRVISLMDVQTKQVRYLRVSRPR